MTSLYDFGENLNETVEQIQDLLDDGVSPDSEEIQSLSNAMSL